MPTKLSLFNGSLELLKERHVTQAEIDGNSREAARTLNSIWDRGAIRSCLEAGQWKFATRTAMLEASASIEPDFGLRHVFERPEDHVRTTGVWMDENLTTPLRSYRDEGGFIFANVDTIFHSYVSDDASYGNDMSLWPQSFIDYVEAHLAYKNSGPLSELGLQMFGLMEKCLHRASGLDAMADPAKRPPVGSWARARFSGYRRDGQPR